MKNLSLAVFLTFVLMACSSSTPQNVAPQTPLSISGECADHPVGVLQALGDEGSVVSTQGGGNQEKPGQHGETRSDRHAKG